MKKTIGMVAGIAFCLVAASVNAQQTWDATKNPTVDSINSKYEGKMLPAKPAVTIDKVFPVLGQYESSINTDAASVSITLDEKSKGIVWVTGLPQGKLKAMLKKSPATYRIPAQVSEDGKQIAEGTLIYDAETNTLRICIGKVFNETDPASAFLPQPEEVVVEKTKGKIAKTTKAAQSKPWMYTGAKTEKSTALNQ
jgi:hypothetical protein